MWEVETPHTRKPTHCKLQSKMQIPHVEGGGVGVRRLRSPVKKGGLGEQSPLIERMGIDLQCELTYGGN